MKENINDFALKVKNEEFRVNVIKKLEEDPDFLEYSDIEQYCKFSGKLSSENLLDLLAIHDLHGSLKILLPYLLQYSDVSTISDEVFSIILEYNKKIRNTLLVVLAHCKISFYQLQYINDLNICNEAFFQLIAIYCENSCFTSEDLKVFLIKNHKKYGKFVKSFLSSKNQISPEKLNILKQYI